MSEKVLGVIRTIRPAFARTINESLFFTSDRVIVARTSGGLGWALAGVVGGAYETYKDHKKTKQFKELSLESILKADKHNYAISNSEITEVKLWKSWGSIKFKIKTKEKDSSQWSGMGTDPKTIDEKGFKIEDYEAILRPAFGDKLSVKK